MSADGLLDSPEAFLDFAGAAPIGTGSLGETFVVSARSGEIFAVTRFHLDVAQDPFLGAFERNQLPRLRAFSRPGILPLSNFFSFEDRPAFATPYARGENIGRYRARPPGEILDRFDGLLAALETVHGAGFVHGGLHLRNLLCDAEGAIQMTGLGLSDLVYRIDPARQRRLDAAGPELSPALRSGEAQPTPADDLFALGTLLYELIASRPPPIVDPQRPEPLPPLVAAAEAGTWSRSLGHLISRLRSADPSQRPASVDALRAELAELRPELPATAANGPATARIAPPAAPAPREAADPTGPAASGPVSPPTQAHRPEAGVHRRAWLGLGAFALLGLLLLFWLETRPQVPSANSPNTETERSSETSAAGRPPVSPPAPGAAAEQEAGVSTFADQRRLAELEEGAAALRERARALADRGAAEWGETSFETLSTQLSALAEALENRRLPAAESAARTAGEQTEALEARAARLLTTSLETGTVALGQNELPKAIKAFETALLLDPESEAARSGLERAGRRPQLLERLEQSRAAEQRGGNLAEAVRLAAEASQIDPEYGPARQWLRQLRTRQQTAAAAAALANHQRRARDFETQEAWARAAAEYERAGQVKRAPEWAARGAERARQRAALDETLVHLTEKPKALFTRSGPEQARAALSRARELNATNSPRLAKQIRVLEARLAEAETPVAVRLQSDGLTDVAIFHVGRQGRFSEKKIELLPRVYTIVGSRNGFRDVRRQLDVPAGAPSLSFDIRCKEAL